MNYTIDAGVPQEAISSILLNIYTSDQPTSLNILVPNNAHDKILNAINDEIDFFPLIITLQTKLNLFCGHISMTCTTGLTNASSLMRVNRPTRTLHFQKKKNTTANNFNDIPIPSCTITKISRLNSQ